MIHKELKPRTKGLEEIHKRMREESEADRVAWKKAQEGDVFDRVEYNLRSIEIAQKAYGDQLSCEGSIRRSAGIPNSCLGCLLSGTKRLLKEVLKERLIP